MPDDHDDLCKWCGGLKALGNPMGNCSHIYWPDALTDEAKRANGYQLVTTQKWVSAEDAERARALRDFELNGQDRW